MLKFESCIFKIMRVMSIFRLPRWCEISCLKFFWNPEILLKFWDIWLIFCMWPLNIPSKKCYIATWGQKLLLPWFLRGGLWGPPHGSHRNRYPMGGRVKIKSFWPKTWITDHPTPVIWLKKNCSISCVCPKKSVWLK